MLTTSALYNSILSGEHSFEHKLTVNGVTYLMGELYGVKTDAHLYKDDVLNAGGCVSSELACMIAPHAGESIPSMARICAYIRAVNTTQQSEWLPMGAWYIGTREKNRSGKLSLHCYDILRARGEQLYTVSGAWTRSTVRSVAQRCAAILGITLEDSSVWSNSIYLDAPPINYTVREVLSCCAAASCGNVSVIVRIESGAMVEKLRLCPIVPVSSGYDLGSNRSGFVLGNTYAAYTHVIVNIEDGEGDTVSREAASSPDNGRTMEVTLYCVTDAAQAQAAANAILAALGSYTYQPYTTSKAWLNPALELGDGFAVGNASVGLFSSEASFSALYTAVIEAPGEDEIESEVPSEDSATRAIERKIATGKASLDVKIGSVRAMVEGLAPAWEANHSYALHDVVAYETKFYECTTAHTSGSTFDSSKWSEISSGTIQTILDLAIGKMTLGVTSASGGSTIELTSGSVRITSAAAMFETDEAHFSGSLSATKVSAGSLDADNISVRKAFAVQMYDDDNEQWVTVGYVGAAEGNDGQSNTKGAVLKSANENSYVIVTNAGVRLQRGNTSLWLEDNNIRYRINGGDTVPLGYAVFS